MNTCIVCGGRTYSDWEKVAQVMSEARRTRGMDRIVVGGASGADTLAERWARREGIPVDIYKAEWSKYGRAAGPRRNAIMLQEGKPQYVIAFPGGRGTANMTRLAREAGIDVIRVAAS